MEQPLSFDFKGPELKALQISIESQYEDIFPPNPAKNEIFITDLQKDSEELISHEITEPEEILQYSIPQNSALSHNVQNHCLTRAKFIHDTIVCNKYDPSEEVSLPVKVLTEFSDLTEVSPAMYSPTFAYWKEGNISSLKSWCGIPKEIFCKYYEYNETARSKLIRERISNLTVKTKLFLSLDAIKYRITELTDMCHSKFLSDFKQGSFSKVLTPAPYRKVVFEIEPYENTVNIRIPYTGVPLMYIGRYSLKCHFHNKSTSKRKNPANSRATGCPATIDILKIMRFPDYDISYFKCGSEQDVIEELRDALTIGSDSIRHYMEYYMNEPELSDHQYHTSDANTVYIPLAMRDEIEDLVQKGVDSSLINKHTLQSTIEDVTGTQSSKHGKYDPTARAIRYMREKALKKLEISKAEAIKEECDSLMSQIAAMSNGTELRNRLQVLRDSILDSSSHVLIEDGDINLELKDVAEDIQIDDPPDDNPALASCPGVWNAINFVECTDQPWIFGSTDDFCNVESLQTLNSEERTG